MSDQPTLKTRDNELWAWHAKCVALADAARQRRNMREWEKWSQAAAAVLVELA